MSYRVLFCGTPEFALPALKQLSASKSFTIVQVITQPDRPAGRGKKMQASVVKKLGEQLAIPVMTPANCRDPKVLQEIADLNADLAIVVAFGQILPQAFLDIFPCGCFNIHGSLLPRWRGAAPIQRAVMAGDSETGVALQKIVLALDAGDIIGERKIPITDEVGSKELFLSLSELGAETLDTDLIDFLAGRKQARPQDESLATYAKKILKSEADIDWRQSAAEIYNQVRGLNLGGPYAQTHFRKQPVKVHRVEVLTESGQPGLIKAVNKQGIVVGCGQQSLLLTEVQPASKSRMKAVDFARGLQVKEGDLFGETL